MLVGSCATSNSSRLFHRADDAVLVIQSINIQTAHVVAPETMEIDSSSKVLDVLKSLAHQKIAVVILENYGEAELGRQFRDRAMGWFMGLRGLGYDHIVFLQGKGTISPDGLIILAEYN